MTLILAILNAIAAIPSMKQILDMAISAYMAAQDEERRKAIGDAAIDLAKAKTQEEKDEALTRRFKSGRT